MKPIQIFTDRKKDEDRYIKANELIFNYLDVCCRPFAQETRIRLQKQFDELPDSKKEAFLSRLKSVKNK
jgi:hypothetical protein